jgi:hypothetical protein
MVFGNDITLVSCVFYRDFFLVKYYIIFFQEQRIHPGAPIDVSLSPTPSEIARLPTGKSPVFQTTAFS